MAPSGRVVRLDFWTSCRINGLHGLPEPEVLEQEFGEALAVVGVHSARVPNERRTESLREAVPRRGIAHLVLNDAGFTVRRAYGVRAWPTRAPTPSGACTRASGRSRRRPGPAGRRSDRPRRAATCGRSRSTRRGTAWSTEAGSPSPWPAATRSDASPRTAPARLERFVGMGRERLADGPRDRAGVNRPSGLATWLGAGRPGRAEGAPGALPEPSGVSVSGRRLFVADTNTHRIAAADLASEAPVEVRLR